MKNFKIMVNGEEKTVEASGEMPLLWALRDLLDLKGTKFGCGRGLCGSCTVHVNGEAVKSCQLPLEEIPKEDKVTTIEGLSPNGEAPLQLAWEKYNVPQCGYCQPGQLMKAQALLNEKSKPNLEDINSSMSENICRCGTYNRIQKAVYFAAHGKEL